MYALGYESMRNPFFQNYFPRVINTANYMNTNVTKYRDTGTFQGAGS